MKKIIIPCLVLYALSSGLGLFLRPGLSDRLLAPWLAGFLFLVFAISYAILFTRERSFGFAYFVLGVIGINFLIQLTGGIASPAFPAYFLLVSAAGIQRRAWAYFVTAVVLAVEALNLLSTGASAQQWQSLGIFSLPLAGVAFITSHLVHRIRTEAREAKASYEKLLSDADAVDPLARENNVEALTRQRLQATNVNAAREREGAFCEIIDRISEMVPAHTYALFLDDHGDGVFSLRGIRSRSRFIAPGSVEFRKGNGLVGICAAQSQRQYLPHMVIPSMSLGYYSQEVPVRSFLAVPILQDDDRVTGVLAVDSLEREAFPPDMQESLARFLPFFSQIIDKIRISVEMDMRAKNFAALHEMSSVLSSSLEMAEVLDTLSDRIRSVVPYDFCAFLAYDVRSDEAILTALKGYDKRLLGARFPVKESAILAHMLTQWQERRVCSIHHDPDLGDRGREIGLFPAREMQHPIKSLFGRPLAVRDKFIGAAFFSSLRTNIFTDYHRTFLDMLLNQVSMIVDNSMLHQRIRDMARTDGLTGLLNHRTFMEKLAEEHKRHDRDPRPFSVLLMDIDKFKGVNDKYGHPVGDAALRAVAAILKDTARGSDFTARYGGEEFAVGMVDTDARGAFQMGERIRKLLEETVVARVFDGPLRITVSIGVSSFPADTRTWADLVPFADEALYDAKHRGRNRVCMYRDIKTADAPAMRDRK